MSQKYSRLLSEYLKIYDQSNKRPIADQYVKLQVSVQKYAMFARALADPNVKNQLKRNKQAIMAYYAEASNLLLKKPRAEVRKIQGTDILLQTTKSMVNGLQGTVISGVIPKNLVQKVRNIDICMIGAKKFTQTLPIKQMTLFLEALAAAAEKNKVATPSVLYMLIVIHMLNEGKSYPSYIYNSNKNLTLKRSTKFFFYSTSTYKIRDFAQIQVPFMQTVQIQAFPREKLSKLFEETTAIQKSNVLALTQKQEQSKKIVTQLARAQQQVLKEVQITLTSQTGQLVPATRLKRYQAIKKWGKDFQIVINKTFLQLQGVQNFNMQGALVKNQGIYKSISNLAERTRVQADLTAKINSAMAMIFNTISLLDDDEKQFEANSEQMKEFFKNTPEPFATKLSNLLSKRYIQKLKLMGDLNKYNIDLKQLQLGLKNINPQTAARQIDQFVVQLQQAAFNYFTNSVQQIQEAILSIQMQASTIEKQSMTRQSIVSIQKSVNSAYKYLQLLANNSTKSLKSVQSYLAQHQQFFQEAGRELVDTIKTSLNRHIQQFTGVNENFVKNLRQYAGEMIQSNRELAQIFNKGLVKVQTLVKNYTQVIAEIGNINQGVNSIKNTQSAIKQDINSVKGRLQDVYSIVDNKNKAQIEMKNKTGAIQQQAKKLQNISSMIKNSEINIQAGFEQIYQVMKEKIPIGINTLIQQIMNTAMSTTQQTRQAALIQLANIIMSFSASSQKLANQFNNFANTTNNYAKSLDQFMLSNQNKTAQLQLKFSNLLDQIGKIPLNNAKALQTVNNDYKTTFQKAYDIGKKKIQSMAQLLAKDVNTRFGFQKLDKLKKLSEFIQQIKQIDPQKKQTMQSIPLVINKTVQMIQKLTNSSVELNQTIQTLRNLKQSKDLQFLVDNDQTIGPTQKLQSDIEQIKQMLLQKYKGNPLMQNYVNKKSRFKILNQPQAKIEDLQRTMQLALIQFGIMIDQLTLTKYDYAGQIINYISQFVDIPNEVISTIQQVISTNILDQLDTVETFTKSKFADIFQQNQSFKRSYDQQKENSRKNKQLTGLYGRIGLQQIADNLRMARQTGQPYLRNTSLDISSIIQANSKKRKM